MCGFSDPRVADLRGYDMPFWLFRRVAEQVFPRAQYLALSCITEPFMTKDLQRRLGLLKDYPVPFAEIITNGTLLDRERIQSLIDSRLSRIGISLDGATAEVFERIRVRARFDRVVSNIRLLTEMKAAAHSTLPEVRLLHVLSETNIDHFRDFLRLAHSLEVQCIDVRTILPFRNAEDRGTQEEEFWVKVRECQDMLHAWTSETGVQIVGHLRGSPEAGNLYDLAGQRQLCRAAFQNIAVRFNGDVLPCMGWSRPPLGNLAHQTFEEVWDSTEARSLRQEFTEKRPGVDCLHCTICRDDSNVEGDAFFETLSKQPPERHPQESS